MAFQYGSGCYVDEASAASAMAASELGATYAAGSAVWSVTGASVSGAAVTFELSDLTTTAVVTKTVSPPFAPCSLLDWEDGLALGWGVGGIWIAAACILALIRARKASP